MESIIKDLWPIWSGILVSYLFKDWILNFIEGILFYLDKNYNEGDVVYINDKKARIIKIGIRSTVFHMIQRGTWLSVRNERIKYHSIEQILNKNGDKK